MDDTQELILFRPPALWRRLLAQIVDLLVFLPFYMGIGFGAELGAVWGTPMPFALAVLLFVPVPVAFLALRGATPGKFLLRMRVIGTDGRTLGWRRAWNRQFLFASVFLLSVLEEGSAMGRLGPGTDIQAVVEEAANHMSAWGWIAQLAASLVWASALLVLVRPDRRGLHDLWGGSIVVPAEGAAVCVRGNETGFVLNSSYG